MLETMPISEKLKMLRDRRGLTLDELAEQTGLSRSALSNYETNESKEVSQFALVTLRNSMAFRRIICWDCQHSKTRCREIFMI